MDSSAAQITDLRFVQQQFMTEKLGALALQRGVLRQDEIERLHQDLERREANSGFLMNFVALRVSGTKPRA